MRAATTGAAASGLELVGSGYHPLTTEGRKADRVLGSTDIYGGRVIA